MVARGWPVDCWRRVLELLRVLRGLLVPRLLRRGLRGLGLRVRLVRGLRQILRRQRLLLTLQVWQHPLLIWALLAAQRLVLQ
jgi:hypothetical protein